MKLLADTVVRFLHLTKAHDGTRCFLTKITSDFVIKSNEPKRYDNNF